MTRPTHRPKSPDNGPKRRGAMEFFDVLNENNRHMPEVPCNPWNLDDPWQFCPDYIWRETVESNNPWDDESLQIRG
jgi:hypothetical protein